MESRFVAVIGFMSPMVISLNYILKSRYCDQNSIIIGSFSGFLISLFLLLTGLDKSLDTKSIKLASIINWISIGGYCGYSLSIGIYSYENMEKLGLILLINCMICCIILIMLYFLSTRKELKKKIPFIYKNHLWDTYSYSLAIFINIILAEIFGNIISIYLGIMYRTLAYILSFGIYMVCVYMSILLAICLAIRRMGFKRKERLYMQ